MCVWDWWRVWPCGGGRMGYRVLAQGGATDAARQRGAESRIRPSRATSSCPTGGTWGSTSAVDIDKDGKSIWVAERCGAEHRAGTAAKNEMSPLDTVLKFDASGKLVAELRHRA